MCVQNDMMIMAVVVMVTLVMFLLVVWWCYECGEDGGDEDVDNGDGDNNFSF
jgi:uncharacterized membrane protein